MNFRVTHGVGHKGGCCFYHNQKRHLIIWKEFYLYECGCMIVKWVWNGALSMVNYSPVLRTGFSKDSTQVYEI